MPASALFGVLRRKQALSVSSLHLLNERLNRMEKFKIGQKGLGVLLFVLALSLTSGRPTSAQLIASESFVYPAGSLIGANSGTGWSGGWFGTANVTAPGLTQNGLPTSGNKATTVGNNVSGLRNLATPISTAGRQIWVSLLTSLVPGSTTDSYAGLMLRDGTGSEVVFIGAGNGSGRYGLEAYGSQGAVGPGLTNSTVTETTRRLVLLLDGTRSENLLDLYLWVDPQSGSVPSLSSANLAYTNTRNPLENFTLVRVGIQSGSSSVGTPMLQNFDEIHMGFDYTSVTTLSPSVAPEPSTLFLLALSLLPWVIRRRRQGSVCLLG